MARTTIVYLVHFSRPYAHASHYLGSTSHLTNRLHEHASGGGARLMAVICAAAIPWRCVRTWRGGRQEERRLKRRGGHARLCPVCNPTIRVRRRPQWLAWTPAHSAVLLQPSERQGDAFGEA